MTTTTRLYTSNAAAGYTPATVRGTWTESAGSANVGKLAGKAGTAATYAVVKAAVGGTWTLLCSRWVSNALTAAYPFSTSDTLQAVLGMKTSSTTNSDIVIDLYAYITTGDSDTPRGTILSNSVGTDIFNTTATGRAWPLTNLTGSVSAQIGDRLVIEVGVQKTGSATGTRTITEDYGNTGGTDLTAGSTSVTTQPGWIELVTASDPWGAGAASSIKTVVGLALASVKTVDQLAIASVKNIYELA